MKDQEIDLGLQRHCDGVGNDHGMRNVNPLFIQKAS